MSRSKIKNSAIFGIISSLLIVIAVTLCTYYENDIQKLLLKLSNTESYNINEIPEYSGENYVVINNNEPEFDEKDYKSDIFEKYSKLDILGRCGVAYANIGKDLMPTEKGEALEWLNQAVGIR